VTAGKDFSAGVNAQGNNVLYIILVSISGKIFYSFLLKDLCKLKAFNIISLIAPILQTTELPMSPGQTRHRTFPKKPGFDASSDESCRIVSKFTPFNIINSPRLF